MRRRLLNLLSVLSLLLCVAACVLWVRSYFVYERVRHLPLTVDGTAFDSSYAEAGQTRGVLWVRAGRTVQARQDGDETDAFHRDHVVKLRRQSWNEGWWVRRPPMDYIPSDRRVLRQRLGLDAHADWGGGRYHWWGWGVSAPHWFLASLTAAAPAAVLVRRLARRRRPAGLCQACGYDLRATPDRCPECGL